MNHLILAAEVAELTWPQAIVLLGFFCNGFILFSLHVKMNASEIITELQRLIEMHGDVPVKQIIGKEWGRFVDDIRYSSGSSSTKPYIKLVSKE